jgi:hypothetical protein
VRCYDKLVLCFTFQLLSQMVPLVFQLKAVHVTESALFDLDLHIGIHHVVLILGRYVGEQNTTVIHRLLSLVVLEINLLSP